MRWASIICYLLAVGTELVQVIKERKREILAKGGQVFANILEGGYDEYEYPEIKVFKRA